jgi:ABC-type multidrug transport system ATPase subunit
MTNVVKTTGLGKRYKKQWALQEIDLSIAEGEILGFIGPNGAGKTTLLSILCGFVRPSAGTVELAPSTRIGLVSDRCGFVPHLSGKKNLELLAAVQRREPPSGVVGCLRAVELDPADKRPVEAYSLGMRQRLMIAQALLVDPGLLLLDEPTNGLDPDGIVLLRRLLLELSERGVAILLASHLLTEVERLCRRVVFVNRGKILQEIHLSAASLPEVRVAFATRADLERFRDRAPFSWSEVERSERDHPEVRLGAGVDMKSLLAFLVKEDIAVEEIRKPRPSLEDAFLALLSK